MTYRGLNYSLFLRARACPTCGSTSSKVYIKSEPDGDLESFEQLRSSWWGFFQNKIFFKYSRCDECDQLYSPLYFTDHALADLYSHMPDNTAGIALPHLEKTQEGYFNYLKQFGVIKGDFLEIGPDIGLFTSKIAYESEVGKIWLHEPNINVHEELSRRTNSKSFEISPKMNDFSAIPDTSISLCAMIHVLDHLPDAREFVSGISKKLTPDGRILIVTHDEQSILAKLLKRKWPAFCLQHPHLFNIDTTHKFLLGCGFEVIKTEKSINYFPLTYMLKHLFYALGFKNIARWNTHAFIVPLKLGNIITLARLKKT